MGNPLLLGKLAQIAAQDQQAEFTLLIPATRVRHLLFRRGTEQDAAVIASELAGRAPTMLQDINLVATRVGSESPTQAIDDEVQAHPGYVGFVISTLPQETSRWLRMDLPSPRPGHVRARRSTTCRPRPNGSDRIGPGGRAANRCQAAATAPNGKPETLGQEPNRSPEQAETTAAGIG